MTSEELNAREEVKDWLTQQIERARGPVKLPALVKRAVKHFMADNKFLRRFVQDFMYRAFYNLAVDELHRMRGPLDLLRAPVRFRPVKPSIWARWERGDMTILRKDEIWKTDGRKGPLTIKLLEDVDTKSDNFFDAELVEGTPRYLSHSREPEEPGEALTFRVGTMTFIERVTE